MTKLQNFASTLIMNTLGNTVMLDTQSTSNEVVFSAQVEKLRIHYKFELANRDIAFRLDLSPFTFTQRGIITETLIKQRPFEREFTWFLLNNLSSGSFFLDVGAHVGYYSMLAAALVGPVGKVLSFEPNKINFEQLNQHAAVNKFLHVITENKAVSSSPGTVQLQICSENDGGHTIVHTGEATTEEVQEISSVILDDYLPIICDFDHGILKIDTEGAEFLVLQGAKKLLERGTIKHIWCEHNYPGLKRQGLTMNDLINYLDQFGYQPYILPHNTSIPAPLPQQRPVEEKICDILFVKE